MIKLDEKEICNIYLTNRIYVKDIAKKYGVNKKTISNILKKNNIEVIKNPPRKNFVDDFVMTNPSEEKYKSKIGYHYVAKSKDYNYESIDYLNRSGKLTSFIANKYNVTIPSKYFRKLHYLKTGDYWWEQWFDIIQVKDKEHKKCPYCDWETSDTSNKCGAFFKHIKNEHGLSKIEHIRKHPEDKSHFQTATNSTNLEFELDYRKFVVCQICGKKLKHINKKHLETHGYTKEQYYEKFKNVKILSDDLYKFKSRLMQNTNTKFKNPSTSKNEKELNEFINSLGFNTRKNRTLLNGREIDIFLDELNLGIEYNGNFWHGEWFGGKNKNYHVSKLEECNKNNVNLITIFEDEYVLKKLIVLSKIKHILNKNNSDKIYAKNCQIRVIDKNIAKIFLDNNHIEGYTSSTVHFGAFYEDILVGVMSVTKSKKNVWEIVRFATLVDKICVGVCGKLFNFFKKNYKYESIISFVDRRFTKDINNNLLTKLGFTLEKINEPRAKYYKSSFDKMKRFNESSFTKTKLINMDSSLSEEMTKTEMLKKLGFDRIWDCGTFKFVYR